MFGISGAEFLVILLVAILVIPARNWPDVARFLARIVRTVRTAMWRITDASEKIKDQIEREAPIDEIIKATTDDMADLVSVPRRGRKRTGARK